MPRLENNIITLKVIEARNMDAKNDFVLASYGASNLVLSVQ